MPFWLIWPTGRTSLKYLLILFGLAELDSPPKTPEELGGYLQQKAISIKSPGWADAAQGAVNIVAGVAANDVQFFILGKYPTLMGKTPQGQNKKFFQTLLNHYLSLIQIGG